MDKNENYSVSQGYFFQLKIMGKKKRSQELKDWPSFFELTEHYDPSTFYYTGWDEGILTPRIHWCYFAEITMANYHPFRPSVLVKDRDGNEHPIIFYLDNGEVLPGYPHDFKVGHTLALLYPSRKMFMDMSEGIRLEDTDYKIFKCSRKQLMIESKKLESGSGSVKGCSSCGKNDLKLSACGRCKLVWYCGQDCQLNHWKEVHQGLCPDMKLLKILIALLKTPFDGFTRFSLLEMMVSSGAK